MARFVKATPLVMTLVLLVMISTGVSAPPATAHADSGDRAALAALYNATDGANWTNNDNWLSNEPIGEWYGVTTDANGRITELDLPDNDLAGEMPAELGNLANLQRLQLGGGYVCESDGCLPDSASANQLSGQIPAWLGNLSNLEGLNLGANQLTGEIPAELGNLSNLEGLNLGANQLTGEIPAWLGNLSNLEGLSLNGNQLAGEIPAALGRLPILEILGIFGNQLTGEIPTELGNLSNLERLYLSDNQLTGEIPAELGNLSNLLQLWLDENQLTGEIPAELENLTNLEDLSLSENQLTGCIPAGLRDVAENDLDLLGLEFCVGTTTPAPGGGDLAGDRAVLVALYNATDGANWTDNAGWLTSSPVEEWSGVDTGPNGRVTFLSLWGNDLNGPIPPELGNLTSLEHLSLGRNQLAGSIPVELRNLSNLEHLELGHNQLTGSIPVELGNLANLTFLRLLSNRLTGSIPSSLGNLTNLESLYLSFNQLTGCVPAGLRDVPDNDFTELGLPFCEDEEPVPADPCLEVESLGALTAAVTKTGAWASDCESEAKSGSYAEYYTFTLDSGTQVEINLTSGVDAYLALRQGAGRDGTMVASNDNVGSRNFNSAINMMLAAGDYTVEATTFFAGQTGDFTLSVRPLQETEDLGTLAGSVDRSNSMWVSDYMSTQQAGSYARSYTFTVDTATHVAINLTSPEDSYLYVLDSNGAVVHESDNVTTRNLNSRIDQILQPGTYTIEATTYHPARMGAFHLSIGVLP